MGREIALTGLEPDISALKGLRPIRLDDGARMGHRGFEPRKTRILSPPAVPIRISPMPHNGYCSTTNYLQGSLTQAILLLISLYRTYEVRTVVLGAPDGTRTRTP